MIVPCVHDKNRNNCNNSNFKKENVIFINNYSHRKAKPVLFYYQQLFFTTFVNLVSFTMRRNLHAVISRLNLMKIYTR